MLLYQHTTNITPEYRRAMVVSHDFYDKEEIIDHLKQNIFDIKELVKTGYLYVPRNYKGVDVYTTILETKTPISVHGSRPFVDENLKPIILSGHRTHYSFISTFYFDNHYIVDLLRGASWSGDSDSEVYCLDDTQPWPRKDIESFIREYANKGKKYVEDNKKQNDEEILRQAKEWGMSMEEHLESISKGKIDLLGRSLSLLAEYKERFEDPTDEDIGRIRVNMMKQDVELALQHPSFFQEFILTYSMSRCMLSTLKCNEGKKIDRDAPVIASKGRRIDFTGIYMSSHMIEYRLKLSKTNQIGEIRNIYVNTYIPEEPFPPNTVGGGEHFNALRFQDQYGGYDIGVVQAFFSRFNTDTDLYLHPNGQFDKLPIVKKMVTGNLTHVYVIFSERDHHRYDAGIAKCFSQHYELIPSRNYKKNFMYSDFVPVSIPKAFVHPKSATECREENMTMKEREEDRKKRQENTQKMLKLRQERNAQPRNKEWYEFLFNMSREERNNEFPYITDQDRRAFDDLNGIRVSIVEQKYLVDFHEEITKLAQPDSAARQSDLTNMSDQLFKLYTYLGRSRDNNEKDLETNEKNIEKRTVTVDELELKLQKIDSECKIRTKNFESFEEYNAVLGSGIKESKELILTLLKDSFEREVGENFATDALEFQRSNLQKELNKKTSESIRSSTIEKIEAIDKEITDRIKGRKELYKSILIMQNKILDNLGTNEDPVKPFNIQREDILKDLMPLRVELDMLKNDNIYLQHACNIQSGNDGAREILKMGKDASLKALDKCYRNIQQFIESDIVNDKYIAIGFTGEALKKRIAELQEKRATDLAGVIESYHAAYREYFYRSSIFEAGDNYNEFANNPSRIIENFTRGINDGIVHFTKQLIDASSDEQKRYEKDSVSSIHQAHMRAECFRDKSVIEAQNDASKRTMDWYSSFFSGYPAALREDFISKVSDQDKHVFALNEQCNKMRNTIEYIEALHAKLQYTDEESGFDSDQLVADCKRILSSDDPLSTAKRLHDKAEEDIKDYTLKYKQGKKLKDIPAELIENKNRAVERRNYIAGLMDTIERNEHRGLDGARELGEYVDNFADEIEELSKEIEKIVTSKDVRNLIESDVRMVINRMHGKILEYNREYIRKQISICKETDEKAFIEYCTSMFDKFESFCINYINGVLDKVFTNIYTVYTDSEEALLEQTKAAVATAEEARSKRNEDRVKKEEAKKKQSEMYEQIKKETGVGRWADELEDEPEQPAKLEEEPKPPTEEHNSHYEVLNRILFGICKGNPYDLERIKKPWLIGDYEHAILKTPQGISIYARDCRGNYVKQYTYDKIINLSRSSSQHLDKKPRASPMEFIAGNKELIEYFQIRMASWETEYEKQPQLRKTNMNKFQALSTDEAYGGEEKGTPETAPASAVEVSPPPFDLKAFMAKMKVHQPNVIKAVTNSSHADDKGKRSYKILTAPSSLPSAQPKRPRPADVGSFEEVATPDFAATINDICKFVVSHMPGIYRVTKNFLVYEDLEPIAGRLPPESPKDEAKGDNE